MSLDDLFIDPFQYPPREAVDDLVAEAMSCLPDSRKDLASKVSHAIRTPLSAILGFREVLLMDQEISPEERNHYQEIIVSEMNRLRRFIETVKTFRVMLDGQLVIRRELRDLRSTVETAVERVRADATTKMIRLEVISMESPIMLMADHDRLRLTIELLLSNAMRATAKEGIVDVEILRGASGVTIVVEDSGHGMNVDEVARLFKPFQRIPRPDDNGGELGLGLTLASVIAERHQGSVSVVSSPMSGARVAVFLPL